MDIIAGMPCVAVEVDCRAAGGRSWRCAEEDVDAEVDAGGIVVQPRCPVEPGDTAEMLKARV